MKKEKWIDISKGIVILLVIFEHSLMQIDFIAKNILMFHMPFFFFISGLCFNSNMNNEEERKWRRKNFKKYLKIYAFLQY